MTHEPLYGWQINSLAQQFRTKRPPKIVRCAGLHSGLFLALLDDVVDRLVGDATGLIVDLAGLFDRQKHRARKIPPQFEPALDSGVGAGIGVGKTLFVALALHLERRRISIVVLDVDAGDLESTQPTYIYKSPRTEIFRQAAAVW